MSVKHAKLSVLGRLVFWCVIAYACVTLISMSVVWAVTHHHVHGRDGKMMRRILSDLQTEYVEFQGLTPKFKLCIDKDVEEHNASKMQISVVSPDGSTLYATSDVLHPDNQLRHECVELPDSNRIVVTYDINNSVDFDWFLAILLAVIAFVSIVVVAIFSRLFGERILKLNNLVETKDRAIAELKMLTDDIAHDLRTPLTRLNMAAEASLAKKSSVELAEKVAHDTELMVEMINTMLEISQTGFRINRTPREEIDLAKLIRQSGELYQSLADDQQIKLEVSLPSSPVYYSAHKAKLQQVLGNLLDNAIKFTPRGGRVSLALETTETVQRIIVRDTGCGISNKDLPYIFKRFYRADASRNLPGNGLGLALVEAIVTSYGGKITCTSTIGVGTVFMVLLPRDSGFCHGGNL